MTDGESVDAARVEELVATVDGLTNELLDLQERVRELEAQLDGETPTHGIEDESKSVEELFAQEDGGTGSAERGSKESTESEPEDVETIGDDILVG
ncbi:MAG: bZIP transcription factor [Halodesulfurarchaeum sp.]|nr:bZIP transcription factor [Halodesulfurarchaeum sp.]